LVGVQVVVNQLYFDE